MSFFSLVFVKFKPTSIIQLGVSSYPHLGNAVENVIFGVHIAGEFFSTRIVNDGENLTEIDLVSIYVMFTCLCTQYVYK